MPFRFFFAVAVMQINQFRRAVEHFDHHGSGSSVALPLHGLLQGWEDFFRSCLNLRINRIGNRVCPGMGKFMGEKTGDSHFKALCGSGLCFDFPPHLRIEDHADHVAVKFTIHLQRRSHASILQRRGDYGEIERPGFSVEAFRP